MVGRRQIQKLRNALFCLASLAVACHTGCGGETGATDRGFLKKTYTDDDGNVSHYVIFAPVHREPEQKLPVILFLNGWGENGDDGLRQISNNFGGDVWRMRGHFPFLAVCPQCSYHGSWNPGSPNAAKALAILDEAIAEYGGDPNRVCITGASAGGGGALALASAYPDRFASVVPVSVGSAGDLAKLASEGMPIWCFYNEKDQQRLTDSARRMRQTLLEAGLSPLVTEFERGGHNAWDSAYGSPALYRWMLEKGVTDRADAPFTLLSATDVLATWKQTESDTWTADGGELTTAADRQADAMLLSPPMFGNAELHLDAFFQKGTQCRLQLLHADANDSFQGEIVVQLPASGGGGLLSFDLLHSVTLDPMAQRALCPGWNDIRLAWTEGVVKLTLNGWPALESKTQSTARSVRWALAVRPGDSPTRWRFLRVRSQGEPNAADDAS